VFWWDRKTAIERDHAAIASDQTKFKVAEGRSKVAVRCDWGIIGTQEIITGVKFGEDRLRNFCLTGCQNLPFPIGVAGRPYNSATLPRAL